MALPEVPPEPQTSLPQPAVSGNDSDAADIEQNKDIAAFSYLWIMSVIVYFLRKKSPFVRFHAKQAMVLFVLSVIVWFIPFINRLLELLVLCLMVFGFINAAQGQKKDVPIIGPLSRGEISIRDAWKQIVDVVGGAVKSFKSSHPSSTPPPSQPASSASEPSPAPVPEQQPTPPPVEPPLPPQP